jgi:uncharacterized membrane protein
LKPLLVLLITFITCLVVVRLGAGFFDFALSGMIAMAVMLLFTASAHFVYLKGMTLMMPDFLPFKKEIVMLTGFIEIAAAIGLLIPRIEYLVSELLILFFIFILPANIHAAAKNIDYQKGTNDGHGLLYLWFRIPLQIFFIAWVYFFGMWK